MSEAKQVTFEELGLNEDLLRGLGDLGFKYATPIQADAIPIILNHEDIIGCAQTGTGKTAAFLLPIIHHIQAKGNPDSLQCLIIVPTRELAIQIDQQLQGLSYYTGISSIAIYGGSDGDTFTKEKTALETGAQIVIATPGRLKVHLSMSYSKLDQLSFLVLDEADRMLDMGFVDDIKLIIAQLPKKRQNLMFSATMAPKIRTLAKDILHEPKEINIAVSMPAEKIIQVGFSVYETQKIPLIQHIFKAKSFNKVIIFCSTKQSTKALFQSLKKLGLNVADIHSDLEQSEREKVLNDFRSEKLNILVATDVLSRGIDIEDIELVINFDVPNEGADYIHRIGRTARAASKGAAFTLIDPSTQRKFQQIEQLIGREVPKGKVPDHLGEAPEYNPSAQKKDSGGYRRKR
ncbi:MAG: ATP-dependent RNA helicase RhlE [Paraglaciecola sp.]|jgi:ATP-dependent RNA helicase RhlE